MQYKAVNEGDLDSRDPCELGVGRLEMGQDPLDHA